MICYPHDVSLPLLLQISQAAPRPSSPPDRCLRRRPLRTRAHAPGRHLTSRRPCRGTPCQPGASRTQTSPRRQTGDSSTTAGPSTATFPWRPGTALPLALSSEPRQDRESGLTLCDSPEALAGSLFQRLLCCRDWQSQK